MRRHGLILGAFLVGALALLESTGAWVQNYPDRPVRIVVPLPAGSPGDAFARALQPALQSPEFQDKWSRLGADIVYSTPEQFTAFLRTDLDKWAKVVKAGDIKAD